MYASQADISFDGSDSKEIISESHTIQNWIRLLTLALPNFMIWNILVLVTVLVDFHLTTIVFVVPFNNMHIYVPILIILDLIYTLNLTLLLLHQFWNRLSRILNETVDTSSIVLVTDLISIFPQITVLLVYFKPQYTDIFLYCRLAISLRLHKLLFFSTVQEKFLQYRWIWFLMQNVVYLFLVLHSANIAWFLCRETVPLNRNFIHSSNLNFIKQYFLTMYLSVQTVFNVGFGDVTASNIYEIIWFLCTMLIGHFLVITFVAGACWLMINKKYNDMMYSQMVFYVHKYMENFENPTKRYIKSYFEELRRNYHGIANNSLLPLLPLTLQMDVALDINYELINKSLLLKNLPSCVQRKIALALDNVLLVPGQPIYYKNVTKRYMVFVKRGILEVFYCEDDHNPAVYFGNGSVLGEAAMFSNISAKTAVRALKCTDLRVLHKRDFLQIMLDYPDELKYIRTIVAKRFDGIVLDNASKLIAAPNLKKRKGRNNETYVNSISEFTSLYRPCNGIELAPPHGIITKGNSLIQTWKFLLCIYQIFCLLWYTYYAVFERYIPGELDKIIVFGDIFCLIDVTLQCVTSVQFKDKIVTKVVDIIDVRLDDWTFWCDVFSLFPIEVLAFTIENSGERQRMYDLLKLNRVLRIWRFGKLFQFLKNGNSHVLWIIKNITYVALFTYYMSCVLYTNACLTIMCHEESWYHQKVIKDLKTNESIEYSDDTLPKSLYFAAMSVFYVGLGDILPQSDTDIAIVICIIVLALFIKTYCTSQLVSSIFLNEFCTKLYEVTSSLTILFNRFQIPKQMRLRMRRYVTTAPYLATKHGHKFIETNTAELLQNELQVSKPRNIFHILNLFEKIDMYFLAMLEKEATVFVLPKNEVLCYYGDPTRQMFVLQRGFCSLYSENYNLEKTIGPGSQVGALEMLVGACKMHTVVADTDCLLVLLEYYKFLNILNLFPKEYYAFNSILTSQWMLTMVEKIKVRKTNRKDYNIIYRKCQSPNLVRINRKKLWQAYKEKLGLFRFLAVVLLPFTIHPYGIFLRIWCSVRCILILLSGLTLPLVIMLPPFADFLYWLTFICQCSLYLDMYILLHVAYYNEEGDLEVYPLRTAWNYITHSFVADLLAALPMHEIIAFHNTVTHLLVPHHHHCMWQFLSLIQFHRVFSYLNYLKLQWIKHKPVDIVRVIVIFVLITNILVSLMLSTVCAYEYTNQDEQSFHNPIKEVAVYGHIKCQNSLWLKGAFFDKIRDPYGLYLIGVYSVVNFLTHTGLGEITTHLWLPMIGIVTAIMLGFLMFLYCFGITIASTLQKALKLDFRKKVKLLKIFLEKDDVDTVVQKQVFDHLKFVWERNKGLSYIKILSNLHLNSSLTEDVLLSQFHTCLKRCALFYQMDTDSLRLIVKDMQLQSFKKGEFIMNYKDVTRSVFIVASGEVNILNADKFIVNAFGIGGAFGNIYAYKHSCSQFYAKAKRNLDLCVIDTDKLLFVVKYYPHICRKMQELLIQGLDYIEPLDVTPYETQKDIRASDFWSEIDLDEEQPPRKKSSIELINPVVALKPHHRLFKVTDLLTFVGSCFNVIFIPYVFVTQDQSSVCYLYLVFEPVFYIQIYLKLRQAYFNFYGSFIKTNRRIARKYFNNLVQVMFDTLSNVPVSLTCFAFVKEEWFFFYSCLRLLHLLRIYYILHYLKIHEEKLKHRIWLPIVKFFITYLILLHLLSCFWLMMVCPFNKCTSENWMFQKYNQSKPPVFKLICSYYYIISLVTNTGIGVTFPETILSVVFSTIVMLLGKIVVAIFIAKLLIKYYFNFDHVRYEYKAATLKKHLQNQDISGYQMRQLWSYIQNLWKHERGCNFPKLLHELPYGLMCTVKTSLYGHHLRHNFIFKRIDEALLRQVCSKLQRLLFFQGDYIVESGDVNPFLYFIHSGTVTVFTKQVNLKDNSVVLHPNDMFGSLQGFGQGTAHRFSYQASSNVVEILTLSFDSWSFLLRHFPEDETIIFSRIKEYSTI